MKTLVNKGIPPRADSRGTRAPKRASEINVLIACEESQAECIAFRNQGFNAFSCDIEPCRKNGHPEWHICSDVTDLLQGRTNFQTCDGHQHDVHSWHMIIAHPPCTYLCRVSAVHLRKDPNYTIRINGRLESVNGSRYMKMMKARKFFYTCLNADAPYVAVENPIPMRLARLPEPSCYAQPSWYGVKYTKKTLYWTRNLPPLMPEIEHPSPKCFVTASRGKYRSRTFPQLADAIARQWGSHIIADLCR